MASRGMKTYSESRIELRNLQMLKKMLKKINSVLSSEQPCGPKSLNVSWILLELKEYARKTCVAVNTGRHLIRVLNERRVTDGGNLCPLWLVIIKLVWHGIGDTLWLQYSWPRAVVSYTFLAVVHWNGLEHSRRKVRKKRKNFVMTSTVCLSSNRS